MSFCSHCRSNDLLELTIEKGEAWYYCYACHTCYSNYYPKIPLAVFCEELRSQGFPRDADRILSGERASEFGE